jgi:hypothetical protein
MDNALNVLSSRAGFNTALRHFKNVTGYVSEINRGVNLADLINESLETGEIERFQVKTILNALLTDKFGYAFRSHNIDQTIEKADQLPDILDEWTNIHLVLSYFNPQEGQYVINPKNSGHWQSVLPLVQDELTVLYAGPVENDLKPSVLHSAIQDFLAMLYGRKLKTKKEYIGLKRPQPLKPPPSQVEAATGAATAPRAVSPGTAAPKAVEAGPAPKRRITPRYSIQVTNELFHNGNVEAWKRIVESYRTKYTDLDVLIWYENERINDINALFKWGKVKHGGLIMFSVAGENIRDVSKLQRYLFEGASPRFEVFLRGGIGKVLDLF